MIDYLKKERIRLRRLFLNQRERLSLQERHAASQRIAARLGAIPVILENKILFIYCHYRCEVETTDIIEQCLIWGKQVCVPLSHPDKAHMLAIAITNPKLDLVPGFKGIPEPRPDLVEKRRQDPATIDVAIIPGVVFDRQGNRLGYGGGFYDRFLAQIAPQAVRIGLTFSSQLIENIPAFPHDIPMDMVITEHELITCSRGVHAPDSRL